MSNLTCLVDKKDYRYCPNCENDKYKPSWYSLFCCENCKNIFTILRDHSLGEITDEIAKEELQKLDLSEKDTFDKDIQTHIDKLLIEKDVKGVKVQPVEEKVEKGETIETEVTPEVKRFVKRKNK